MAKRLNSTRYSAISQVVLGTLLVISGIADRAAIYKLSAFHTASVVPIWMGAWIIMTGVIGYFGSRKNRERPSTALIGTYLGFSIVSIIFAGVIIIIYSVGIPYLLRGKRCSHHKCTSVGLGSVVIIFSVIEFCVGIWAYACCCSLDNGCCNPAPQPKMGQVFYIQTEHGAAAYVVTQGPNGVRVAVPAIMPGHAQMVSPAANIVHPNSYDNVQHREQPPSYQESVPPGQV